MYRHFFCPRLEERPTDDLLPMLQLRQALLAKTADGPQEVRLDQRGAQGWPC